MLPVAASRAAISGDAASQPTRIAGVRIFVVVPRYTTVSGSMPNRAGSGATSYRNSPS